MRPRLRVAVLTAALLLSQGAVALTATADEHTPRLETIADGLNGPRGVAIDEDGTIYVAEAGFGGDEACVTIGEGDDASEMCFGPSASVTAIAPDGTASRILDDLPSVRISEGEYVGVSDIAIAPDGALWLTMGLGESSLVRDEAAEEWAPAAAMGTVQRYAGDVLTQIADLAEWETENDPDADSPSTQPPMGQESDHSNPNGILITDDGTVLVADAGGNTILEIDPDTGDITMLAVLADRFVDAPPFLGLPAGAQMPMQAVPTNLALDDDDEVLISQLTGFPFPAGGARVYQLGDDEVEVVAEGFTNAMDLLVLNGELYVLELAQDGLLAGPNGALVRVRSDDTRAVVLRDSLFAPGGMAADADDLLVITVGSVGPPGSGAVLRFDPSQAADPSIQSACPPLEVGGNTLTDISGTTHEEAITCAVWHGLFAGFGDGTFGPGAAITRGQFATTVANLIRATGADLPTADGTDFTDVAGTTHATAISDLADAGLVAGFGDGTFRPGAQVTRAQAVSILVASYGFITGDDLPEGPDAFDDDDGSVHEANINAAAAMDWVRGTGERTVNPSANITRGQMASTLTRAASDLVDGGFLNLPG